MEENINKDLEAEVVAAEAATSSTKERKIRIPEKSQFFGQPKNWGRGPAGFFKLKEMQGTYSQAEFHKVALTEVKKSLKGKCKHLIHVANPEGIQFRAKLKVNGVTKTINVDAEVKKASQLTADNYKALKDVLNDIIGG